MTSNLQIPWQRRRRIARPLDPEERFQRRVTLGFIALIVAIVVMSSSASATATGTSTSSRSRPSTARSREDQWADRAKLETSASTRRTGASREALAAGDLTAAQADARSRRSRPRQTKSPTTHRELIDLTFKGQLAAEAGVSGHRRRRGRGGGRGRPCARAAPRVGLIVVAPERRRHGHDRSIATGRLHAARRRAPRSTPGTPFEEVAKQYSTGRRRKDKGGDYGSIGQDDTTLDPTLVRRHLQRRRRASTTPLITGRGRHLPHRRA